MNFHRAQTHIFDASTHRQLDIIENSKMFPNSAVNNNNITSNHIESHRIAKRSDNKRFGRRQIKTNKIKLNEHVHMHARPIRISKSHKHEICFT